jgi:hypothetical protein
MTEKIDDLLARRYCEACRHLDPTPKRSKRP